MTTELRVITLTYKRDSDQDGNKKLFSLSFNLSIIFSINQLAIPENCEKCFQKERKKPENILI